MSFYEIQLKLDSLLEVGSFTTTTAIFMLENGNEVLDTDPDQ